MGFRWTRPARFRANAADPRGAGLKVAMVAGVAMLGIAAIVFSTSFATRDVASDGLVALQGEGALGANDLAFKALGQFVLLAEDRELGVADDAVVDRAAEEASGAISDLETRVAELISLVPASEAILQDSLDRVV